MFLGATTWQYYLPNRTFFGITEMPPFIAQLAEVRPQIEAKPAAETKSAPSASNQPVVGNGGTALVDNSRTK
jgi:hypothetical protein